MDSLIIALVSIGLNVLLSLVGFFLRTALKRNEERLDDLQKEIARTREDYVSHDALQQILQPLQQDLRDIKRDVKDLLTRSI